MTRLGNGLLFLLATSGVLPLVASSPAEQLPPDWTRVSVNWMFHQTQDPMTDLVTTTLMSVTKASSSASWALALGCFQSSNRSAIDATGRHLVTDISIVSNHHIIAPSLGVIHVRFDKMAIEPYAVENDQDGEGFHFKEVQGRILKSMLRGSTMAVRSTSDSNQRVDAGPVAVFRLEGLAGAMKRTPQPCQQEFKRVMGAR